VSMALLNETLLSPSRRGKGHERTNPAQKIAKERCKRILRSIHTTKNRAEAIARRLLSPSAIVLPEITADMRQLCGLPGREGLSTSAAGRRVGVATTIEHEASVLCLSRLCFVSFADCYIDLCVSLEPATDFRLSDVGVFGVEYMNHDGRPVLPSR
jgi:hypothetical protein